LIHGTTTTGDIFRLEHRSLHIRDLVEGRVAKSSWVVKEGDKVKVKLVGFDDRGKVRLSMRLVDQQTGEDLEGREKLEQQEAGE